MQAVKEDIRKERSGLQSADILTFFRVAEFFTTYHHAKQTSMQVLQSYLHHLVALALRLALLLMQFSGYIVEATAGKKPVRRGKCPSQCRAVWSYCCHDG